MKLTPQLAQGKLTALNVEMKFTGDRDGETVLTLPGDKDINLEYWNEVSDFRAANASVSSPSPDERVLKYQPGAPITVTYSITQKLPSGPFRTIIEPTYFSTLGQAVFSKLKDREARYRFDWGQMPGGWSYGSDLEQEDMRRGGSADDLLGSALMGGSNVAIEERRHGKGRLRLAMPRGGKLDPRSFADTASRVAQTSDRMWHNQGSDYFISVTPVKDWYSQGGLNFDDAFAAYIGPEPERDRILYLLSHEYLHTVLSKPLGEGKDWTKNAWVREGFPDYYANLANLRAGEYPLTTFAQFWNETLLDYAISPLHLKPDAETNEKFFTDPAGPRIAYTRGTMMAALLDYRIRKASSNKVNLNQVLLQIMKDLKSGAGKGEVPERMVEVARRLANVDLQPDLDRYLGRGEELLLPADLFGNCATVANVEIPTYSQGFGGIFGRPIERVDPKGPAYAAGMRPGMVLVRFASGRRGDTRKELAVVVRDGDQEKVIRYWPVGSGTVKIQEVRVRPGMSSGEGAECARLIGGYP